MVVKSERHSQDENNKMLRPLAVATSRTICNQHFVPKWGHSILPQNKLAMNLTRAMSADNPQNLPSLPVPELNKTIDKYLKSVRPLLSDEEFATTTKVFQKFAEPSGDGQKLQNYLLDKAKININWLEQWWIEAAYLGFREPVVVHSSPGQTIPLVTFNNEEERLNYAAKLIMAAASYKMLIDSKKLPVDKMGKKELDMNQYNKIFGTSRVPNLPIDDIQFNPKSLHIVVVHNNHFYKLDLFNSDGLPLSEKQVLGQLKKIMLETSKPTEPVGILSSDQRDKWATAYKLLIKDPSNLKSAKDIQACLFLVCIDAPYTPHQQDNRRTLAGRQLVHGGGSTANSGNRWFDKTVQFILGTDGVVGLTYEHSPSEGQPIAVMVDYLYNFIQKDAGKKVPDGSHNKDPVQLPFKVDKVVKLAIEIAKKDIDKLVKNFDLNCFSFKNYGKNFIKEQKLSPDSYFQMAMQFAFYRLHNKPAPHYESAATRQYIGGRTETIRSCSIESVAFAKAMLDTNKSDTEKVKALKDAINSHKVYSMEAVNGFGVDRHLLGLKIAAKELGMAVPAIFKDLSYVRSTHMLLSTSQVATKCDGFMCYGPTSHDGYACCYNPRDNDINMGIGTFADCPETSSTKFRASLEKCLAEMKDVLVKVQKAKI